MKSDVDNITKILGDGFPAEICSARFRSSELIEMAIKARNSETELTICGIEPIDKETYKRLCYEGKGFLRFKIHECPKL